jgi:protein tyrosine/serine phosphatase
MMALLRAELENRNGRLVLEWARPGAEPPPVRVRTGERPVDLHREAVVAEGVGGSIEVPRAGLRTYALLTPLDDSADEVVVGERRVDLPGTTNVRDVGGYPLEDGTRVAWGRLFRAEALIEAPPDADRVIEVLDLRTVVDLRGPQERERLPSAWSQMGVRSFLTADIPDGVDGEGSSIMGALRRGELTRFDIDDLADFYVASLERMAPEYGRVIGALAKPGALPGLVHCMAGKDRTGLVVALALSAIGVERADVLTDFALTERYRPNRLAAFRAELEALAVVPEDVEHVFGSPPAALARALSELEDRHGSVRAYLEGPCGLPDDAVERLRDALVSPVPAPHAPLRSPEMTTSAAPGTTTPSARFLVLHALALKGLAPDEVLEAITGLEQDVLREEIDRLVDDGLARRREGRVTGSMLTGEGRTAHAELLAQDTEGCADALDRSYTAFLPLNSAFKEVCTRWQVNGETGAPNDHTDADYDTAVIDDLVGIHGSITGALEPAVAALPRFGRYGDRFTDALARVRAGETAAFARPMAESYHDIWMELHEDLLRSSGRERSEDDGF